MPSQAATLLVAVVLVTSAATKLASPSPARLLAGRVFGADARGAAAAVALLAAVEYALAIGLAVTPTVPVLLATLVLFAAFAALGVHQVATRSRIACGCLGVLGSHPVGRRQIVQLAPVAALLAFASTLHPDAVTAGLGWLLAAHLFACALLVAGFAGRWHTVRGQRRSLSAASRLAG